MPSMGIKFLIDGKKSENLVLMPSFTGMHEETNERSWDFFRDDFKNRVKRFPEGCYREAMEKKLLEATNKPYAVGITGPARINELGKYKNIDCEEGE